jgi:UrcA family protein
MFKFINRMAAIAPIALAAVPLLVLSPAAHAAPAQQVTVSIADLNLSRPADIARFEDRVTTAASAACAASVRNNQTTNIMPHQQCVARARSSAVAQLSASSRRAVMEAVAAQPTALASR